MDRCIIEVIKFGIMGSVRRALYNGAAVALSFARPQGLQNTVTASKIYPQKTAQTCRRARFVACDATSMPVVTRDTVITEDPINNVTDNIFSKIGVNLHQKPNHPLCIIKNAIHDYFKGVSRLC